MRRNSLVIGPVCKQARWQIFKYPLSLLPFLSFLTGSFSRFLSLSLYSRKKKKRTKGKIVSRHFALGSPIIWRAIQKLGFWEATQTLKLRHRLYCFAFAAAQEKKRKKRCRCFDLRVTGTSPPPTPTVPFPLLRTFPSIAPLQSSKSGSKISSLSPSTASEVNLLHPPSEYSVLLLPILKICSYATTCFKCSLCCYLGFG